MTIRRNLKSLAVPVAFAILAAVAPPFAVAAGPNEPSVDLSNMLQGRYDGVAGPGNQLHVVVQPRAASASSTYVFDVTIQGKYEDRTISLRGPLKVDREGTAARLTWSNGRASCDFPVKRVGDAFEGQTLRDACMTAFQLPAPGTWTIHIEPGTVTIKSVETGETLRFAKSQK